MREIILLFEGNLESERKVADIIQEAIFSTLGQERMVVRQFVNQPKDAKARLVIGTPAQVGKGLEVPEFLRQYGKSSENGEQPLKE